MYSIQNGNVYFESASEFRQVGLETKVDTVRVDNETVEDVTYLFDVEVGEYVEQSREQRAEPLPPTPESESDKIAKLQVENDLLKERDAQIQSDINAIIDALLG